MSPVLEVDSAFKRFGDTQALAGASFTLANAECLGLLGPNGAGKTTLIRAITGRVSLDRGEIRLRGQRLDQSSQARDVRRSLGVIPQSLALYPLLTARENLTLFGKFLGLRKDRLKERVDWAVQWSGLEQRCDDPVDDYSGGMQRRLNIVCGILHQPDVILLDEPTAGVDPQSRERIWTMLGDLREQGASLVLTTHQLEEAQRQCQRIVIIDNGRTVAAGTFAELLDQSVGAGQRVTLRVAREHAQNEATSEERTQLHMVKDLAKELPELLSQVARSGDRLVDMQVDSPTLQDVFIHFTGRELRDGDANSAA